jgi:diaminopimelate decarboxylase
MNLDPASDTTDPLLLSPRISTGLQDLISRTDLLRPLVTALGSPLNVLLPEVVATNHDRFAEVYRRHHLGGEIYFAHKANRSSAVVRHLAAGPARLDVASLSELQHGLSSGFTPDRLMVTGPKDPELLWLAARTGATVNADSLAEVAALGEIVRAHALPRVPVLLRLSGFARHGTTVLTRSSRFGIDVVDLGAALDLLDAHRDDLHLIGVAYHLDTIGLTEKASAIEGCLHALAESRRRGHDARVLDIGGGFGADYVEDAEQWDAWTSALTASVLGRRRPITWQGHGYGLRSEGGVLRGTLGLYPAARPLSGPRYLDQLLQQPAPSLGRPLATLLLENLYELWIEPGRALLDQAGLVLTTVREVRSGPDGDLLVRLGMNGRDVSLEEHGVVMDPVLLSGSVRDGGPVGAYLLGNLCLESDLVTRRRVHLPRRPEPGDLLAWVNTAGYLMDFSADQALQQHVARSVALTRDTGAWQWRLDDQYWPAAAPATAPHGPLDDDRTGKHPRSTSPAGRPA